MINDETFSGILVEIADGESVRSILKRRGIAFSTFYSYIEKSPHNAERYARAKDTQLEAIAEEIMEISDDSSSDDSFDKDGNRKINNEWVQRSRLRVDSRKWLLAKLKPKKYGDAVALSHEHKGEVKIVIAPDEADV